jgi:hypothetical protein
MENKATIDRKEMQHSDKELASSSIMAVGTLNGLHYVLFLYQLSWVKLILTREKKKKKKTRPITNIFCKSCV